MRAWIYQDSKQVKKVGKAKASFYVGWIDPSGKRRCQSCGPGSEGKRHAEKLRKKREAELITGTYQSNSKKTWYEFRAEYEAKIASGMLPQTRRLILDALNEFERIIKPCRMSAIKTQTIDEFIAKRRQARGKKKGELLSVATLNKDLRHLRSVLRIAAEWEYLSAMPKVRLQKEPENLPTYVTPEHFAQIYEACDLARLPNDFPYPASQWWRGVLITGYMTGWRIGEILAMLREDVDMETEQAITRSTDNKGKRDEQVILHPIFIEHLKAVPSFDTHFFPWNHNERTVYAEFLRIQHDAGIKLACRQDHCHTPYCFVYGFHDLRRAFATLNAAKLSADALQTLMRHKSYLTTKRYINMTRQLDEAVAAIHVPEFLRSAQG